MPNTYTTVQGDTWDFIAYKALGSELYMHKLIDANAAHRNTAIFDGGVILALPSISTPISDKLPPWKRS